MKSGLDSYRQHRRVCSVLFQPLFPVNTSTWRSGNAPRCGSCCSIGGLQWPHMFLPLWMQKHTHVHQWHIWDTSPLTHSKDAHIWRNTHFSNAHLSYKQISDKWFDPSTSIKIWLWQNLSSKYSNYSHTYLRILIFSCKWCLSKKGFQLVLLL